METQNNPASAPEAEPVTAQSVLDLLVEVGEYVTDPALAEKVHRVVTTLGLLSKLESAGTAEPGGKPHHPGGVGIYNMRVRVDNRKLNQFMSSDDHDVMGLLESSHTVEHAMVAAWMNRVFEGSPVALEVKPERCINEGNSGFHLLTLVTDGYGYMVAEDQYGGSLGEFNLDLLAMDPDDDKAAAKVMVEGATKLVTEYFSLSDDES